MLLHLVAFLSVAVASVVGQEECSNIQCPMACPYGFARDERGCTMCTCQEQECMGMTCATGKVCKVYRPSSNLEPWAVCVDPTLPPHCQDPMDRGMCKAQIARWYYDQDQSDCMQFLYSGCGGNQNQFHSRAECLASCQTGSSRAGCPVLQCTMLCRHGFLTDARGCEVCQCAKVNDHLGDTKTNFEVGVGCEGDGEAFCDLQCIHGYQMDSNGCTLCACMSPPNCPQLEQDCPYCPHGLRVDDEGCEICECREEGECPLVNCPSLCPYGKEKDQFGCERCMCLPDPCLTTGCPSRTVCKPSNTTTGFSAKCLTESSYNNPGCPEKECRMMCEHGFKTDRRGCEVCECIKNFTQCTRPQCEPCHFGYAFTEEGCSTCTCLPDPCLSTICSSDEACVAVRYPFCKECNPYPKCVATARIEKLMVRMEFQFQGEAAINHEQLKTELKKQLSELMEVEENLIGGIQVEEAESSNTIAVSYHISKGDADLVLQFQTCRDKLLRKEPSYHGVTVDGVQFVPRTESLMASYSEDEPESGESSSGEDGTVAVVIGCVIGVILLVILIAMLVVMIKNKKAQKDNSKKNIIYRKAQSNQDV